MHKRCTPITNLYDMTITVTMGKLPPFEIEEATDEQKLQTLEFIEAMHEDDGEDTSILRPKFNPMFKTNIEEGK